MDLGLAGGADPGSWRNAVGSNTATDPLQRHQDDEPVVCALPNVLLVGVAEFRDPTRTRRSGRRLSACFFRLLPTCIQIGDQIGDNQRPPFQFDLGLRRLLTIRLRFGLRCHQSVRASL